MQVRYGKNVFRTFEEICGGVYVCVFVCVCVCVRVCVCMCLQNSLFLPLRLLAITLDGSDSLTGECTLTKVQPHSSKPSQRPQKLQDGEKPKK